MDFNRAPRAMLLLILDPATAPTASSPHRRARFVPVPVPYTDDHAQSVVPELTKRCASDSVEKLAGTVAGAQVDPCPHQPGAFQSPRSQGSNRAEPRLSGQREQSPRSAGRCA